MKKNIDPGIFGLSNKVKLTEIDKNNIAIIKKRKSRIIMTDGNNILKQANKIKEKQPGLKISLIISGPICSKTVNFLKTNDINIINQL